MQDYQYYVENSHPAIITPEEFDLVQAEFLKRTGKQFSSTSVYSSKIICGDCGCYFGAKVWHSNSKYRRVIYQCNNKFKGEHICSTPHLYEPEIQQKFMNAFSRYFENRGAIVQNCKFVLKQLKKNDLVQLQAEFDDINAKMLTYIHGETDLDYQELNAKYEEISAKLDAEEEKATQRKGRIAKMKEVLKFLESDGFEEFDENLWSTVLENMTVFHDGNVVFQFWDGTEVKI